MINDVIEVDATTGKITKRDYTTGEQEQFDADKAKFNAQIVAETAQAEANAAAKAALLARLGITADEATLLLS